MNSTKAVQGEGVKVSAVAVALRDSLGHLAVVDSCAATPDDGRLQIADIGVSPALGHPDIGETVLIKGKAGDRGPPERPSVRTSRR
ncbi:hypothetical protein [Micromonospora sp. NPDC047527]|uniref:hypothetical protein n=1 Tax=Micromonospora sp. NPDC047527 TaxID=3155144 RepID=UPI0033E706E8